ncbi:hypothetical protein NPA07_04945 [Mycoplasmopsis caviae]|uniref:Uncharacterized protein n=1 Tax=Mycoplasmopsis caviae TaxID=55603 RepID=A0A3P8MDN8_9BACT|nr:hypothetical protein [Mycoplasmopsis caviae]UUD35123.1 hypothetical protein NPA07_04945 [Mycoplasmopsis caviae]VDR42060.1 Uncharacterised protein [Mycoplasmopsis caviae]
MKQNIDSNNKKYTFDQKVDAYTKVYRSNLRHLSIKNQMSIKTFGLIFIFMVILVIITSIASVWQAKAESSKVYTILLITLICVFLIMLVVSLYYLCLLFVEYSLIKSIGDNKDEEVIIKAVKKYVKFGLKKYPEKQIKMLEEF